MLHLMGKMRRATTVVAVGVAAGAAFATSAHGATTTYPGGGSAFDGGTAEGWVASGETCSLLSGTITCTTTAAHQTTGGDPDGAIATNVEVLLNVLGVFQGSALWTSPTFAVPAGAPVTGATLQIDEELVGGGLLSLSPTSSVTVTLADLTTPETTDLVTTPLDTTVVGFQTVDAAVPAGKVVAGHSYELRIGTTMTNTGTSIGLLGTASTLLDNVRLAVTTQDPVTGGPDPGPGTPGAPGAPGSPGSPGAPGADPPTLSPGARELRRSYSSAQIATIMSGLSINADAGTGPGGSLVPLATCTIVGTPGADRILGTKGNDVICGLGGNDTIEGAGGRDVIDGANGNDRISGGAGADLLLGLRGNDRDNGGSGNDRLGGGLGRDRLAGGAGRDRVSARGGNDRLDGGRGRDRLAGGAGRDRIAARDRMRDVVRGGPGRDVARADIVRSTKNGVRGLRVADLVSGVERVR
jgi:hypothetical protein